MAFEDTDDWSRRRIISFFFYFSDASLEVKSGLIRQSHHCPGSRVICALTVLWMNILYTQDPQ